ERLLVALPQLETRVRAQHGACERRRPGVVHGALVSVAEPPGEGDVACEGSRPLSPRRPEPPDPLAPLAARPERIAALAGVALQIDDAAGGGRQALQHLDERAMLPAVAHVAGVEAVAVVGGGSRSVVRSGCGHGRRAGYVACGSGSRRGAIPGAA